MLLAGVMTGTSLDAIDVAICDINSEGDRHTVTLVYFLSAPYPKDLEESVKGALAGTASVKDLAELPFTIAKAYCNTILSAQKLAGVTVDAVAIHGQTLWHEPPTSTWQAASGPALSALLRLPVVHDFRTADIALGGQGAPLVPIFDHAFLGGTLNRVALNIGGMANITILPKHCSVNQVRAFDTGPGNVLINAVCRLSYGKQYDSGGRIARAGAVIPHALEVLQQHPYFKLAPPKSTGRETFGDGMAEELWRRYAHPSAPSEDLVATLTEVSAWSIAHHISQYMPDCEEVVVSGGGAMNTYLLERIALHLPGIAITTSATYGIGIQAKEAMAFAYLGYRTLHHLHGNIPNVTGASRSTVLGSVCSAI